MWKSTRILARFVALSVSNNNHSDNIKNFNKLMDMNVFLNKYSHQIMTVVASFTLSMIVGYTIKIPIWRNDDTNDSFHRCEKDSLELMFNGTISRSQLEDKGMINNIKSFREKSPQGYVNTPAKAIRIAIAVITQEYGVPCRIGLEKYKIYSCDSLWIVKSEANISGQKVTIIVEINKMTGRIWRIDKYIHQRDGEDDT